jgi:uncharacterized membrane protein YidH (DUF202 family)
MVHPVRDTLIALFLTLAGLGALAYGLPRLMVDENDVPGSIASVVGGLTAFFASLMLLNFLWALRLANRIRRGELTLARWIVPAETMSAYVAAEKARPWNMRSRWRPRSGAAAEVIFTPDGVLAGGLYHGLASSGTQHFVSVDLLDGNPGTLQFATREISGGPGDSFRWFASVLRLPVAPGSEDAAGQVLTHFRQVRSGTLLVKPQFWPKRIRIGRVAMGLGAVVVGIGWFLSKQTGWHLDDAKGASSLILFIVGIAMVICGAVIAAIAAKFHRQQLGKSSTPTPR